MRLWNWFAVVVLALLLLMAACDDDGDGDGDPDATAAPTATVATDGGDSDEPDGDGAATGPFASFAGTYEGTWTNDTFATTADVTIEIAIDGATATFTLTLEEGPEGSPFGVMGLSADGTISESGIELTYTVTLQDGTEASGTATLERT